MWAMHTPHDLDLRDALALHAQGNGFTASISPDWAQGRTVFGGLIAGLAARAVEQRVSSERPFRSLLVNFVGPVAPGTVQIEVEVLREGRALTQATARVLQNEQVCTLLVAALGAARATQVKQTAPAPSPAPAPHELGRAPFVAGMSPTFTKHFDYRWSSEAYPFTGAERGFIEGYVRHAGPADSDVAGLLCLIDAWPPTLLPLMRAPAPTSSVTWMVDVLAPEAIGKHAWDAFYRFEATTVAADQGYGSTEGRLWAPDGTLVAASRQLVVEFSR